MVRTVYIFYHYCDVYSVYHHNCLVVKVLMPANRLTELWPKLIVQFLHFLGQWHNLFEDRCPNLCCITRGTNDISPKVKRNKIEQMCGNLSFPASMGVQRADQWCDVRSTRYRAQWPVTLRIWTSSMSVVLLYARIFVSSDITHKEMCISPRLQITRSL